MTGSMPFGFQPIVAVNVVYLLWLHDAVLGVFRDHATALVAAANYRKRPEFIGVTWAKSKGTDRWHTTDRSRLSGLHHVSRLEVERRPIN